MQLFLSEACLLAWVSKASGPMHAQSGVERERAPVARSLLAAGHGRWW